LVHYTLPIHILNSPGYIKGKGQGLSTFYRATYSSQTRDQQRFAISEMTADCGKRIVS